MLTMYLCSKGSKETIIWTSNQVLIPSSLGALVIGWNSMLAILMLLLPKLLNNSTCSVYWADQALRLKTVTICISSIGSALEYCRAVWQHILTSYHSEEVEYIRKCTLKIIKPAPSCRCMKCLKLPRLDERQSELCLDTIRKIPRGKPTLQTSHYDEGVCTPLPSRELYNTNSYNWKITS